MFKYLKPSDLLKLALASKTCHQVVDGNKKDEFIFAE